MLQSSSSRPPPSILLHHVNVMQAPRPDRLRIRVRDRVVATRRIDARIPQLLRYVPQAPSAQGAGPVAHEQRMEAWDQYAYYRQSEITHVRRGEVGDEHLLADCLNAVGQHPKIRRRIAR